MMTKKKQKSHRVIVVYTDGGSRGNPGPAAIGIFVATLNKRYGEFLGNKTNNEAEYEAVVYALKKVKQLMGKVRAREISVEIRSDSQLIVSQLNGEYKLKERNLWPYFISIWNLRQDFENVSFAHVSREENAVADRLLNETLDGHAHASRKLF